MRVISWFGQRGSKGPTAKGQNTGTQGASAADWGFTVCQVRRRRLAILYCIFFACVISYIYIYISDFTGDKSASALDRLRSWIECNIYKFSSINTYHVYSMSDAVLMCWGHYSSANKEAKPTEWHFLVVPEGGHPGLGCPGLTSWVLCWWSCPVISLCLCTLISSYKHKLYWVSGSLMTVFEFSCLL